MDSPHSDHEAGSRATEPGQVQECFASLERAIQNGEWLRASELTSRLETLPGVVDLHSIEKRLVALHACLTMARAARSHLAARLHRVKVAAAFAR